MSIKELDLLIEQALKEREYVSGSRLPTWRGGKDFDIEPLRQIHTPTLFKEGIKTMAAFCEKATTRYSPRKISDKFERLVSIEMMHKFLNTSIPDTDAIGFDPTTAGYALEKILGSFLGGTVLKPKREGSRWYNADDLMFNYKDKESFYSLKFYSENSIKNYGFGQAMTTLISWIENAGPRQNLKYGIFVKDKSEGKVGFKAYYKEFSYTDILEKLNSFLEENTGINYNKHTKKIKNNYNNMPQDNKPEETTYFEDYFDNLKKEITKDTSDKKTTIILGNQKSLGAPFATLSMPRSIDELMNYIFKELGEDVNQLYASLDGFKDELEKYFRSDREDPNPASKSLQTLENSWNEQVKQSTVSESKLQSLDDLIAETIRDIKKNKKII